MSKFDNKKIMPRFYFLAILMTILGVIIIGKAAYVMSAKRAYWLEVASRVKKDSVQVSATRGNILSCDGKILASSMPEYKLFVDFKTIHDAGMDSLWEVKVDSISLGLSHIFGDRTKEQYRHYLQQGKHEQSRRWPIYDKRVDYNTYCEVKTLPIFQMRGYKGGFYCEEFDARQHPYGSLALRTIGALYPGKDQAKNGLELFYDSLLRGTNGIIHRRKVLNKYLNITDTPPIDGADIVTTIDVSLQDLAERAVLREIKEIEAQVGVAIVMDVKTGDIKAIVNMERNDDGTYSERKNHAISDLMEPGSVFKTVSLMTVLDDGMCDTSRVVETGCGIFDMHGRPMRDHNWRKGGYHTITMGRSLEVSSNIGVSRIVEDYYGKNPEKFVEGVYRTGIANDFKLPLNGYTPAHIRKPKKNARGQWTNWSKTALAWMSIGYETQVPPISTLTFYNAIANGGRMMNPRFVQRVVKNGETLIELPPQVVKEHICKETTLKKVQAMLERVVSNGTGKTARSKSFKIAGKTGTAQVAQGGSYKNGRMKYLLSFAGYFPADAPRYSCIVCIQKTGLPASGGMSASVFREIAEGSMAQNIKMDVSDSRDSSSVAVPDVKNGNINSASIVLNHLGIKTRGFTPSASFSTTWGKGERSNHSVTLTRTSNYGRHQVPDVMGMGAKDAVYLLESRGIKVTLSGRGKVAKQSLPPGQKITRRLSCHLTLV